MGIIKRTLAGLTIGALVAVSSISGAFAQSASLTVGEYFNTLSAKQRAELRFKVAMEEAHKMLDNGWGKECECVVLKIAMKEDGSMGDGVILMLAHLKSLKKKGKLDVSVEQAIRGVMIHLFNRCHSELEQENDKPQ